VGDIDDYLTEQYRRQASAVTAWGQLAGQAGKIPRRRLNPIVAFLWTLTRELFLFKW